MALAAILVNDIQPAEGAVDPIVGRVFSSSDIVSGSEGTGTGGPGILLRYGG